MVLILCPNLPTGEKSVLSLKALKHGVTKLLPGINSQGCGFYTYLYLEMTFHSKNLEIF